MSYSGGSEHTYINQTEASALAGVSPSTLMRFAEAGYFRIVKNNGQAQFSKKEIYDVFGPAITMASPRSDDTTAATSAPLSEEPAKNETAQSSTSEISAQNEQDMAITVESSNQELKSASELAAKVEKINVSEDYEETSSRIDNSHSIDAFRKVLQLQEELLAQKESKIQDLMKERDWLRSRLEKMEDKSDRDQMLLMVESQKVRTLIDKNTPKPGVIRLALGWLSGNKENNETQS